MFDVRPVDETGDLDWKKIQGIGGFAECVGDEPSSGERNFQPELNEELLGGESLDRNLEYDGSGLNAYVLGTRIESKDLPILHDEEFNLGSQCVGDENRDITFAGVQFSQEEKILEEQKQIYLACEEARLLKIAEQNHLIQQKEEARIKREEIVHAQARAHQEKLEKIAEQNRKRDEEYAMSVLAEREKREHQKNEWLEKEMQAEMKARELQEASAKKTEKIKKKKVSKKGWLGDESLAEDFSWRKLFAPLNFSLQFANNGPLMTFAVVALVVSLGVGSVTYVSKGFGIKGRVLGASTDGLANLNSAIGDISHQNFEGSSQKFDEALANFSDGSAQLESMGGVLLDATRFVPFASKVSSGKNAIEAGKHFASAGKSLNEVARVASGIKDLQNPSSQSSPSLLDVLNVAEKNITDAKNELDLAQQNMDRISIDDLPENNRDKFLLVKQKLPDLRSALDFFLNNSHILADLLGGNGPRKYLFLFQNNSEMRATGGFIGSYGLLDIADGHVKKFFIDGIFNPDGQLTDKIVPPAPIQKISASWSMHDSNWFADFPTSAKKAISFYEKTGGPTADGVIAFTPTVMQKLLEITGPIDMPEYGVTLDSKNFIELTQFKVEVDYDKQENKPKKILSDLAPLMLEKLLSSRDAETISKTAQAFLSGLSEKHILFYSENDELQKIISEQGWSGEIISAPKDYLSVVNTNVNGFKTDAVVDESISHKAEIQLDGSIIDTVSITRKHNGGNSQYDWLNKVNADYMRVYVPEGSKLLEVSGQTREIDKPPLNYDALGFKRDADVQKEENSIVIDEKSGTQIFTEAGKTVFANWAYVSPQESVTVTYKYLLPFTLFKVSVSDKQQADSYSLVAQKQAGSIGSAFSLQISYPSNYEVKWNFPDTAQKGWSEIKSDSSLKTDKFEGVVFEKK